MVAGEGCEEINTHLCGFAEMILKRAAGREYIDSESQVCLTRVTSRPKTKPLFVVVQYRRNRARMGPPVVPDWRPI